MEQFSTHIVGTQITYGSYKNTRLWGEVCNFHLCWHGPYFEKQSSECHLSMDMTAFFNFMKILIINLKSATVASIHSASWVLIFIFLTFVSYLFWYWFSRIFFFFSLLILPSFEIFGCQLPVAHLLLLLSAVSRHAAQYEQYLNSCCGGSISSPPNLSWPSLLLAFGENHCYQPFSTSGMRRGKEGENGEVD